MQHMQLEYFGPADEWACVWVCWWREAGVQPQG